MVSDLSSEGGLGFWRGGSRILVARWASEIDGVGDGGVRTAENILLRSEKVTAFIRTFAKRALKASEIDPVVSACNAGISMDRRLMGCSISG